ncbi:MAG: hypothetical protein ACP5D2_02460 [Candidatus Nanoarchaeia archaeon]
MWKLILEDCSEELLKVLQDIGERDSKFYYYIQENEIVIPLDNKDMAYRKGMWLNKKTNIKPKFRVEYEIK